LFWQRSKKADQALHSSLSQRQKKPIGSERQEGIRLPSKKIDEPRKIQEKSQELQEAMTLCRTRVPWTISGNLFVGLLGKGNTFELRALRAALRYLKFCQGLEDVKSPVPTPPYANI
jgi:hypothetical protein